MFTQGAVRLAKKHYVISSMWVAGLIILTFFRGLTVPDENLTKYNQAVKSIDFNKLYRLQNDAWVAEEQFRHSKGWFSCDHVCQVGPERFVGVHPSGKSLDGGRELSRRLSRKCLTGALIA